MNRAISIILSILIVVAVALAIIQPDFLPGGDDEDKDRPQTVQVAGIGAGDKGAFFADPKVIKALADHDIKVSYDLIGNKQLAHDLRFGDYGFVWPATQDDVDTVLREERTADQTKLFMTKEVVAAHQSEANALITAGVASKDAAGAYNFDTLAYNRALSAGAVQEIPNAIESPDAFEDFTEAKIGAIRTTEQGVIMLGAKGVIAMYPAPEVEISLPMLTLDDGGAKLARALTEDKTLIALQIAYGYRTGDDKAFIESAKNLGIAAK